jgi:hypothetical protein
MKLKLKPINKVKTKGEAQQLAIEYQSWVSEQSLSWGEVAFYSNYFRELGKKFGLIKEFKENAII